MLISGKALETHTGGYQVDALVLIDWMWQHPTVTLIVASVALLSLVVPTRWHKAKDFSGNSRGEISAALWRWHFGPQHSTFECQGVKWIAEGVILVLRYVWSRVISQIHKG